MLCPFQVGNFTEKFNGAWGWADANCDEEFVYICKMIREPRLQQPQRAPSVPIQLC